MTDGAAVLLRQLGTWIERLNQTGEALAAREVGSKLRKRVQVRFETDIGKQRKVFEGLKGNIANGLSLELCWSTFRLARRDSLPLLQECLAFIEGALVRREGLDGGLCELADAMLYELSRQADIAWERFTIMAEGEFFAELSGIIRLRFPETSIWDLPIAAHEFGHFLAHRLKDDPFQAMVEREARLEPRYKPFLEEHFADLFATYALGPAFALNCILLRFDPLTAFDSGKEHPADAERAWWIVQTLRKMNKSEGPGPPLYDHIIEVVEEAWSAATTAAAGEQRTLEADTTARLARWLEELYDLVSTEMPGVWYRRWLQAQGLAQGLAEQKAPELDKSYRIPDILNAAWLWRAGQDPEDPYKLRAVGQQAFEKCQAVSRRKD